jgi:CubicO group peptidase (beta-lactamase class C family)
MKKTGKRIIYGGLAIVGAALIGFAVYLNSLLPIITGYAAKNLCSAVFVSGRQPDDALSLDLRFSFIKYTKNRVNFEDKSVTSRFLWGSSKAIYRPGFGTTLVRGVPEEQLRKVTFPAGGEAAYSQDTIKWPLGDILPETETGIDKSRLEEISKSLIKDNAYNGTAFAFMVIHKGIPVAEAYKPQFTYKTRFLSWSMAKSFVNSLVGILVKEGRMDIDKPADIGAWKSDNRSRITVNNLMQMQSGLKWNEDYGNRSDVTLMLHLESDMGRYAFDRPEAFPAGTHWYYSSGSTNIVSSLIRKQLGSDSAYYLFAKKKLFNKIGMPDALFETDPSGTIIGSSYLYATARDYGRFAMLWMNDGVFNGERILPEGWVKYTTTPAADSKGIYGSFFWLNRSRALPSVPEDAFLCEGHDGQYICIIPSKDLIIVELGYSPSSKGGMDLNRLIADVLSTVK